MSSPSTRTAIGRPRPAAVAILAADGAARWGVLAACLAAAVAVLALVAGAIGEQRRRAGAARDAGRGCVRPRRTVVVRGDRAGRGERWAARGGFGGRSVTLPYSPNARHVTGVAGERSFAGLGGLVPHDAHRAARRRATRSASSRSTTAPTVWVDGRQVARHTGAYLPFEARVRLAAGRHALVVRADWRDPAAMKADAWHRTWFNFGGINRAVSIRAARRQRARLAVDRHAAGGADGAVGRRRGRRRATAPRAADDRACAARWRGAALRFAPVQLGPRRARHACAPACASRAPSCGRPATRRSRRCASPSPARRSSRARVGLRELRWKRRAAAPQRRAARAARRVAPGGRAGPRRRAAPTPTWTRSSRA